MIDVILRAEVCGVQCGETCDDDHEVVRAAVAVGASAEGISVEETVEERLVAMLNP